MPTTLPIIVTTQAELTAALANNARIELGADIVITSTVSINALTGVVIDGKGSAIDGNNAAQCFNIKQSVELTLMNLIVSRGFISVSRRVRELHHTPAAFNSFFLVLRLQHFCVTHD
jgi:hypothetical protein